MEAPSELAQLFGRDRESHLYGLADLAEPYWSGSTWWRRGDAAVGLVPLPASDAVAFYAVSPAAPQATLDLFAEVHDQLPPGATGSGPLGLVRRLAPLRRVEDLGPRRKQVVTVEDLVRVDPPPGIPIAPLDATNHDELVALHATDPGAVFFVRSMWDGGMHVGARDRDGTLIAAAGTHVLDRHHGVAAIGAVLTRPQHRGRGLAAAVVSQLAADLLAEGLTVGLNVHDGNHAARQVYDRLGFHLVHRYHEARLR